MIFADLPANAVVFVDANTLVYHFEPHPIFGPACTALLKRVELGEITALTSTHVLSEVAHRLMTMEAMKRFGWPFAGIAQRLRQHPGEVRQLSDFRDAIELVPKLGLQVVAPAASLIATGAAVSQQTGLLSNDALVVAVMREHGLVNLASNDADFDRVPGLTRYAPA
jgi:predicted nucleic acid-binding protein